MSQGEMPIGDLGPELAVLLAGIAALLLAMVLSQRRLWLCLWPALGGVGVAMVMAVSQLGAYRLIFSGNFALDAATGWARRQMSSWISARRRRGFIWLRCPNTGFGG
ncbi:hypothetical protein LCGC14_2354030 [marine sediment metagenome]|uniref:Uncharacterized protein n=1 Tax=marine sediment metagenome TaxID=412755 RepID=A0A0F9C886_9ZZZZ